MRSIVVVIAILVLFPGVVSASPKLDTAFKWGFGCSIAMDGLDLYSTVYAHEQREDIVEGNRAVYGDDFRVGNLKRPIIIKAVGSGVINGTGYWMMKNGLGVWGNVLVWGNCIGKGIVSARNFAIANDAPTPPSSLRVAFTLTRRF